MLSVEQLFHFDNLSLVMITLVSFVIPSIVSFSSRYLKGDSKQSTFYFNLLMLLPIIFVMVTADHILLLLVAWITSNYFLTRLMLHKCQWEAARQSYILAIKNYGLGFIFLGCSFLFLYIATGETSIQIILNKSITKNWLVISSFFMLLAAMTQSALWPFHRWLTSSLNSPTPVSAIMHAGLVNAGGFILARFAPMLLKQPLILNTIFSIGIITAILGTLWKLMQSDVKRMLACSTMGQMGFMFVQCGLGLFPAAIAHLCWHGLFKAYLFLASGSTAQEKRFDLKYPPSLKNFSLALICGGVGAYVFSLTSDKNIFIVDTNWFLILIAMIAGTQLSLPIICSRTWAKFPLALFIVTAIGTLYGLNIHFIEEVLFPLNISGQQPFTVMHLVAFLILTSAWLFIVFAHQSIRTHYPKWALKIYVYMLNKSQPHPKTVTAYRNEYQY